VSKLSKLVVLAAVLVASLSAAGSASALHVRVRGSTHITGTGGPSLLTNHTGSQTLQCTSSGARADLRRRAVGTTTSAVSHDVKLSFGGCTIGGVVGITVSCNNTSVLNVTGKTGSVVHGTITNVVCDIRLGSGTTSTCHVRTQTSPAGATQRVSYNNAGRISTVPGGATNIGLTGSPSGCTLKNGTNARFSNTAGTPLQMVVSPAVTIDVN
jgi:hypothetical protein